MMKLFLGAVVLVLVQAGPRGGHMGFGAAPCVVTGNELFINGLPTRNLTSSEQRELQQYQQNVQSYNAQMKAIIQERKQEMRNYNNNGNYRDNGYNQQSEELPSAPERPSFCSDEAITQYVFDGCTIQNNKVYIGRQYARDLTSSEVQQLQDFDTQLEAYEDYLQQQIQNKVNAFVGQSPLLSQLFNGGSTTPSSTTGATSSPGPAPQAPTAPNFCTTIY